MGEKENKMKEKDAVYVFFRQSPKFSLAVI
jgi:hypothetical protein